MAATAIFIHFRSNRHRRFLLHNATSTVRFYSSSDDNSHNPNSRFSDIKSTLKTTENTRTTSFHSPIPNTNTNPKPKAASLEEISKSLSKFKRAAPVVSFQELYQRNKTPKPDTGSGSGSGSQGPDLQEIRRSLKGIGSNPARSQSATGLNSKLRPKNSNEMQSDSTAKGNVSNEAKTGLGRLYSYGDMGEKLRSLRPRNKNVRFSLEELNERLQKVREMEEKDMSAGQFGPLRESLQKLSSVEQTKKKEVSISGLLLGETTRLSLEPPKEVLVEKYFHPDHMSSAEKQKLELKKVRDKFKVSESDCGSARVQEELNERLQKVQEMEEKEIAARSIGPLRKGLKKLSCVERTKTKEEELNERLQKVQEMEEKEIAAGPIGLLSERFKKLSCGEQTNTKEGSGGCLYVKVSMDGAPYLKDD